MRSVFLLSALLSSTLSTLAQTGIKGALYDASNDSPIEYGSVAVYNQNDSMLVSGAVSSLEGSFAVVGLKYGNYYLSATFMGYETTFINNIIIAKSGIVDLGRIAIRPNQTMLDEIEVKGEKAATIHQIDRQVYGAEQFQSAKGGTATDLLRNLPSVTVNAQGEITARGTSGFVVLINGKPVQTDATAILNQLPANAVQNIELITAPSAKYDPEGKGGIINIITTSNDATDGTYVQANLRVGAPSVQNYDNARYAQRYGLDFTFNHRAGKWDVSVGGSFQRNDIAGRREGDVWTMRGDTLTRFPSDGERSTDEINYSGRVTLGYTASKADHFSLGVYAGKRNTDRTADILYYDNHHEYQGTRLSTMQYFNENLRTRTGDFALGSFDYSHEFENNSLLSASLLYEYTLLGGPTTNRNLGWPDRSVVFQDEYNTNNNPLFGTRAQIDYKAKPFSLGTVEMGYQFRNLDHAGDFIYERKNNETGIFELIPEFSSEVNLTRLIHSGYAMLSGKREKWTYGAGIRTEYMNRSLELKDKIGLVDTTYRYDFVKPFPSANVQYTVSDDLTVKAVYSKRIERTATFKMNPFPEREHSETLEQGDPTLLPEFIDLVELGAVKNMGEQSVFVTAYFRNVDNVINRVNTVYNDTILNRIYSNVGTAKSAGLELGTELKVSKMWKAFVGANVYHYAIVGSFDSRPMNNASWVYSINVNTTLNLCETFSLQWTINYQSKRVTAQGEDSRFLSPNLTLRKTFMNDQLSASLQWLNMDMGLLPTNEQRITTGRPGEFYTTTNYVYEVDMVILNLSYTLNRSKNKARFIKSEFGEKEF